MFSTSFQPDFSAIPAQTILHASTLNNGSLNRFRNIPAQDHFPSITILNLILCRTPSISLLDGGLV